MPLPRRRPPRLGVHQLEDRTVPAVGDLYLSEALFTPLFGDQNIDQYIELRGRANAAVAPGTYLVVLDGDAPGANSQTGRANAVFDLGGLTLGSDGYLVFLEGGSKYKVRSTATVLRGSGTDGFAGTPGNRFAGSATIGSNLEFIFGANSFLLVESPVKPTPNTDYDTNDDGTLDGGAARWTVLDSVGTLGTFTGADATNVGYGRINFAVGGLGKVPAGSTLVNTPDFGYVARVGESGGYGPRDWVAAQVVNNEAATATPIYRIESSLFGFPNVGYLAGRALDHIGTANFVASVGGTKFLDANGNGARDAGEGGQQGSTLYADRNFDGQFDSFTATADADDLPGGAELTNAFLGVTLTEENYVGNSVQYGRGIASSENSGNTTTGTRTFGRNGINWFDAGSRLRMDFYKPVQAVSIDFVAGASVDYYGRLDAFAADGTLLATYRSDPLQSSATRLAITRPTADIAYATAYSDPAGSPFGYFDNLTYTRPEDTGTSTADGSYRVDGLQDGTYRVRELRRSGFAQTFPNAPSFYDARIDNTVPVRGRDFGNTAGGSAGLTGNPALAVGAGGGRGVVYRASGDAQLNPNAAAPLPIIPFADSPFTGVLRAATADVNGDGIPDTVVVTGAGTPLRFAVVDGTDNATLVVAPTPVFAGSEGFDGGAFVAAGDIDADGRAELVFTPDQGGGPRVTIYSLLPSAGLSVRANFLGINDTNFRGGARAAVGDVNGDGRADLLVAAGFGGGPRVSLYDGRSVLNTTRQKLIGDFFVFDPSLRNGVYAAIGDVNADGRGDLVFGAGPGGAPRLFAVSGQTLLGGGVRGAFANPLVNFFVAGNSSDRGGVRVSILDVDGDRRADIAAGSGEGSPARVRVYRGATLAGNAEPANFQDLAPFGGETLADGVYVG
ncbi:MAG: VCBS repeat-containing protein [Gemmataceae bacterium]|nr:VCBS repeat-containing protein [Gemmataceae bacterium]